MRFQSSASAEVAAARPGDKERDSLVSLKDRLQLGRGQNTLRIASSSVAMGRVLGANSLPELEEIALAQIPELGADDAIRLNSRGGSGPRRELRGPTAFRCKGPGEGVLGPKPFPDIGRGFTPYDQRDLGPVAYPVKDVAASDRR